MVTELIACATFAYITGYVAEVFDRDDSIMQDL
jgi:hypothetical protein